MELVKIAFIGGGMMGEAIIGGTLKSGAVKPSAIRVAEVDLERCDYLTKKYGITAGPSISESIKDVDVIVLAVRPQNIEQVLNSLKELNVLNTTLIFSVVAGLTIERIQNTIGVPVPVIRTMPNTPCTVGMGMTVWVKSNNVTAEQLELSKTLLRSMGDETEVDDEKMLDMAVLSGSLPAVLFLFMESLIDAGVHMGFSRSVARRLVISTVRGSAEYALNLPDMHMAALRAQVVSPGGATAEAISELEKASFRAALSSAIWGAFTRAGELGKL